MLKKVFLILNLFVFSACSTVPYNPRREVKVEKKWYGTSFKQGDNRVNPSDLAKKLGRKPRYQKQIKSFNSNYKFAQALGLLAGFGFGWSAGGGFDETGTLVASLLMAGGSAYLFDKSAKQLSPLVDQRNKLVYNYKMIDFKYYQVKSPGVKIMLPVYSYKF